MNFLQDRTFLLKLNRRKINTYYAAILLLDFETETPLARLEGKVVSGNLSVAATSVTRRTGSFTLLFDNSTYDITSIRNLIAINKKISFSIGIENPYFNTKQYEDYGEILWFKQGVFFITSATSSISVQGQTVSINIIDKMGGLNGVCGGTLPASVSFHETQITDGEENVTIEYPTIRDIIYEAVHHFGGEHPSRIIVEDVPKVGRKIVKYNGSLPINVAKPQEGDSVKGRSFFIGDINPGQAKDYDTYYKGNLIGYMETPLIYPGELIMKAGSTVTGVLDAIVKTLGNYEYFYDVDGNFHFRQKRNFQTTEMAPLNFYESGDAQLQALYMPVYTNYQYLNEFADTFLVTQVSNQPKYDNIKNDFICWGSKNDSSGNSKVVRYHLAIDKRPEDIYDIDGLEKSLCHRDIYEVRDKETNLVLRYQLDTGSANPEEVSTRIARSLKDSFNLTEDYFNWREELYRKALLAYGTSTRGSDYDEELIAEWRKIFDPESKDFKSRWEQQFPVDEKWLGYCPEVRTDPSKLVYWLDIIDSSAPIGRYSISKIGKRSKVTENSKINEVFDLEVPDVVYIVNPRDKELLIDSIQEYIAKGQDFSIVNESILQYFNFVNSYGTCYEEVRSMLYSNLLYNTSVNLTCLPIFYLDVNCVVRLNFKDLGICGDYAINSISWQLNQQSSTMSLQLNEASVMA